MLHITKSDLMIKSRMRRIVNLLIPSLIVNIEIIVRDIISLTKLPGVEILDDLALAEEALIHFDHIDFWLID